MSGNRESMIERVAKAIAKHFDNVEGYSEPYDSDMQSSFDDMARAAIEAMREPGLIIIEEASYSAEYSDAWDYVITAALSEAEPT